MNVSNPVKNDTDRKAGVNWAGQKLGGPPSRASDVLKVHDGCTIPAVSDLIANQVDRLELRISYIEARRMPEEIEAQSPLNHLLHGGAMLV